MQKGNASSNFSSLECAILERPCCFKAKEEEENPAVITVPEIIQLSFKKCPETALRWIFISPQLSSVEILTPNVVMLGGGAFGRWWGHKGGALVNGRGDPQRALVQAVLWGCGRRIAIYEPGSGASSPHPECTRPRSWTSRPPELRNKHLWVISHPAWWWSVRGAWMD